MLALILSYFWQVCMYEKFNVSFSKWPSFFLPLSPCFHGILPHKFSTNNVVHLGRLWILSLFSGKLRTQLIRNKKHSPLIPLFVHQVRHKKIAEVSLIGIHLDSQRSLCTVLISSMFLGLPYNWISSLGTILHVEEGTTTLPYLPI